MRIAHHFTVDVEEYFHAGALEPFVKRTDWARLPSRVASQVYRLLELLERFHARATFFTLGWVAEREPGLLKLMVRQGHEVASHGWDHQRVTHQTPQTFRDTIRRSKQRLEDLCGTQVVGFRAPNFSIVPGREWALDILVEEGYRYDSSMYPVRRPGYGYPKAPPDPHCLRREAGDLWEVPPATIRFLGSLLPAGGGAYFRLLPYALVRAALTRAARRGVPGTFYVHPWEIDDEQPRLSRGWLTRLRHYGGLKRASGRLSRLLGEFQFTTVADSMGFM
jgi:polysaccharide deacetylase family protein (PEP-CTERM system associated)